MKGNREHQIDRIFREGLENGQVSPPPHLWRDIAAAAPQGRRKRGAYFFWLAGAAAIILAAVGIWQLNKPDSNAHQEQFLAKEVGPVIPREDNDTGKEILGNTHKAEAHHQGNKGPEAAPATDSSPSSFPVKSINPLEKNPSANHSLTNNHQVKNPQSPVQNDPEDKGISKEIVSPDGGNAIASQNPKSNGEPSDPGEKPRKAPRSTLELLHMLVPGQEKPITARNDVPPMEPGIILPAEAESANRWLIAGNFGPDLGLPGQSISGFTNNDQELGLSADDPSASPEESVTAFTTGLRVGYALTDRVQLQSGANYATRKGSLESGIPSTSSVAGVFNSTSGPTEYRVNSVEIPVLLRYDVLHGEKIRYFISSGLSTQWLTGFTQTDAAGQVSDVGGQRSQPEQLNVLLGTGLEILPVPQVGIQLEPILRYGTMEKAYPTGYARPRGLTLNTGINFRF